MWLTVSQIMRLFGDEGEEEEREQETKIEMTKARTDKQDDEAPPVQWRRHFSIKHGLDYYYENPMTGETTWSPPTKNVN